VSGKTTLEPALLPNRLVKQILDQARASPGAEVCGLLAAKNGRPVRCLAVANVAAQPERCFNMDPKQQIDAMREMRERGEQLYGIYHSHPSGPPEPSPTDIQQAAYPEALYLIVSPGRAAGPQLHGYRLRDGKAQRVQLLTVPASTPSG
jgi:proteasome lid subunit RPN8/RPN11